MAPLAGAAIASCSILLLLLVPYATGQGQPPEASSSEAWAEGLPPEASEEALTMLLPEGGCGAFAGLVAATAGVGEAFREQSADIFGLTIFCPDDEAVGAFIPRFNDLPVDGQVSLLLYHGLTMAYSEEALRNNSGAFTLDGERMLSIRDHRGTMILSSSPPSSRTEARITKTVVDDDHLAVYLIDAVLIPTEPKPGPSFWNFLNLAVPCTCISLFSCVPAGKMVQGSRYCLRFGRPCHSRRATRTLVSLWPLQSASPPLPGSFPRMACSRRLV